MTGLPGARIFHVADGDAWARAGASPTFARDQLERHGFVHCCTREQLTEIAEWWFPDHDSLVALEIDAGALTPEVRYEPSPTRWYPHVYGALDCAAVTCAHPLPRESDGRVVLPAALAEPSPVYVLRGRMGAAVREVTWRDDDVTGDPVLTAAARAAVDAKAPIEVFGGVVSPASLVGAYESFCVLASLVDEVVDYRGDGIPAT